MNIRQEFYDEVRPHLASCLNRYLESYDKYVNVDGIRAHYAGLGGRASLRFYQWVRENRPQVVVETGVCNGVSSYTLLKAMNMNGCGHLWSIDYPRYIGETVDGEVSCRRKPGKQLCAMVPRDWGVGWIVPQGLRDRWTLVLGDAREHLGPVLESAGEIDLFIHDSLHLEEHILWECRSVWPRMREGGLCAIDNARQNNADHILSEEFNRKRIFIQGNRTIGFVK